MVVPGFFKNRTGQLRKIEPGNQHMQPRRTRDLLWGAFPFLPTLVPRLCLGTHCLRGSASRGGASGTVRSQAEPGNEARRSGNAPVVMQVVMHGTPVVSSC